MKKILFVVNEYPAISETFIADQINYFRDKGFIVHVLSHALNDNTLDNGSFFATNIGRNAFSRLFSVLKILSSRKRFFKKIKLFNYFKYGRNSINLVLLSISNHFINNDYDIIYCHFGNNGKFISQLKQAGFIKANIKIAVHFHGVDLNIRVYSPQFYKSLNKNVDTIVVGSDLAIENLKKLQIYSQKRVIKVPVSLDFKKFPIRNYIDRNTLNIISVGRLIELKGHLEALEVISEFKKRYCRSFHLYIIGDGPLLETLQAKIQEYNLADSVSLLGAYSHSDTLKLLYQSDIYLYCGIIDKEGRQEMQGLSIIEAMASGCTIVSSTVGGVKEYLTDKNAFVCTPRNINCFVDKLIIASDDEERASILRINARNTVVTNFDREKNYERLITVLCDQQLPQN